jgi:UPF0176 protein
MTIGQVKKGQETAPQTPVKIVAIYKFATLKDCADLQPQVAQFCKDKGIRGTLLLAPEGINGTVAGTPAAIDELVHWLENGNIFGGRLRNAEIKFAQAANMPFYRMKVRLKSEIVTLRAPEADPSQKVGTYVAPEDWNDLIAQEDIVVLDTRNDYEVALGTFEGALDPATKTFTEFKDYVAKNLDPAVNKKVAMFCTGGIRCEKASSYMLNQGFEEVFHLKGGILRYLEDVPETQSTWNGECFVFDERVAVKHGLQEGEAQLCRACRYPLSPKDRAHPDYIEGVQCQHCAGQAAEKRQRAAARQRQIELAKERGVAHMGDDAQSAAAAAAKAKKQKRAADRKRNQLNSGQ